MAARLRVRLLGTGGAANERRHQACLLVEWGGRSDPGRLLLDTGSGMDVVRQLVAARCEPTEVRDIFVSHQHADHVGGLEPLLLWSAIRLLRERRHPPEAETRVHAEPRVLAVIGRMLDALATVVPRLYGPALRWVPCADGTELALPGGARARTFLVDHQPVDGGALGCVIERGGARVVYSGDTRPTSHLVDAARGADLLIHEAAGLDEQAAEVHRQGHSTGGDAGRAARAAGVGRLLLTHLPADPLAAAILAEARDAFAGPVELASDLAVVETD
jgi:ribonuclease BN (tRNA processing enzyme)